MMALLLMVHVYGEDIQAEEASFTEIWENNVYLGKWLCNAAMLRAKELLKYGQLLCNAYDCLCNLLLVS